MRYTQRTQLCDKMKARQSESCNCVQNDNQLYFIAISNHSGIYTLPAHAFPLRKRRGTEGEAT
jgi:hypothetical protein